MSPPKGKGPKVIAGQRAVIEAIRAGRVHEVLVAGKAGAREGQPSTGRHRAALEAAAEAGVPVRQVTRERLDTLAKDHRGIAATLKTPGSRPSPRSRTQEATPPRETDLSERDLATFPYTPDALVVLLDGVTDPQNLGAAARSAEAAGAAVLVTRTHRGAPVTPAAVRASSGALLHLPHARVANISRAIGRLQDAGFTVAGLDGDQGEDIYSSPRPEGRLAVVVGSEGEGMSRLVRERCDQLVALPMRGRVGSLNASAALAAVLYAWAIAPPGRG